MHEGATCPCFFMVCTAVRVAAAILLSKRVRTYGETVIQDHNIMKRVESAPVSSAVYSGKVACYK
jgi:hypothetical protein